MNWRITTSGLPSGKWVIFLRKSKLDIAHGKLVGGIGTSFLNSQGQFKGEYTHIGYYHEGGGLGGIANEKKLVTFVKKAWYNKKASSGIGCWGTSNGCSDGEIAPLKVETRYIGGRGFKWGRYTDTFLQAINKGYDPMPPCCIDGKQTPGFNYYKRNRTISGFTLFPERRNAEWLSLGRILWASRKW